MIEFFIFSALGVLTDAILDWYRSDKKDKTPFRFKAYTYWLAIFAGILLTLILAIFAFDFQFKETSYLHVYIFSHTVASILRRFLGILLRLYPKDPSVKPQSISVPNYIWRDYFN